MSRLTAAVIGLALMVAVTARVDAHEIKPLSYRVNRVAVIGDSYTTGTDEGGLGPRCWTTRAWRLLAQRGLRITADVAAEGRAGYGVRGDHGSVFTDLTARAVQPGDAMVVFFGSRNDQGVDRELLAASARDAFHLAHRMAPSAKLLVIGPPWPTAEVPDAVLAVRDVLAAAAGSVGAVFADPIADRWFVDRPGLIGSDGVHPNDAGHEYLADRIAPLVGAQLAG